MPNHGYMRSFFFCTLLCFLSVSAHAQQNQPRKPPSTSSDPSQPSVQYPNPYLQQYRETQHPVYYPPPSSIRVYDEPNSSGSSPFLFRPVQGITKTKKKNPPKSPAKERVVYTKDITKDTIDIEPLKTSISLPESNPQVAITCPNGIVDPGEDCDGGQCCDEHCKFKASGTPCDDGDPGTINDVCGLRGRCGGFLPGGCLSHCSYRPSINLYGSSPSGCDRVEDTTRPYSAPHSRCSLSPFFAGTLPPLFDPFLLGLTGLILMRWRIRNRKD